MKHALFIVVLLSFAQVASGSAAFGQSDDENALPEREVAAPYDSKLMRLAEVLGSIHYLRNLCRAEEGNRWREIMASLLTAEKPSPKRKQRLIARFNRGYRAFNETYGTCTPSAATAGERYRNEGIQLASQINRRYGR